jgi:DNA-binding SARP family transcriptional activator
MSQLSVRLFGQFRVCCDEQDVVGLDAHNVQKLFCYLLLQRDRPHPREALAELLWDTTSAALAKKHLRQTLWHLQSTLDAYLDPDHERVLITQPDWIRLQLKDGLWLDAAVFEQTYLLARDIPGGQLSGEQAQTLEMAAKLYRGDLLEGWYQDWCLLERERLQNLYIAMLNKLMAYYDVHQRYDAGIALGECILRIDSARESTHRGLMRLYYQADERTEALRQYERCVAALARELGVGPSRRTIALYEEIRSDRLHQPPAPPTTPLPATERLATPRDTLGRLKRLQLLLVDLERQLGREIDSIGFVLQER